MVHDDDDNGESGVRHEPLPAASLTVPIFKMGRPRLRGLSWPPPVLAAGAHGRCRAGVPSYLPTEAAHGRARLREATATRPMNFTCALPPALGAGTKAKDGDRPAAGAVGPSPGARVRRPRADHAPIDFAQCRARGFYSEPRMCLKIFLFIIHIVPQE